MINDGFCAPCRAIFCGTWERSEGKVSGTEPLYLHHPNAHSFKQALEMQCPLCVRIWMEMEQPTLLTSTNVGAVSQEKNAVLGSTTYTMSFYRPTPTSDCSSGSANGYTSVKLQLIPSHGKYQNLPWLQLVLKSVFSAQKPSH